MPPRSPTFAITDFWKQFVPAQDPVVQALVRSMGPGSEWGHPVSTAELVLFSVFGATHMTAAGTKVGFSAEGRAAPDNRAHWTIDSRYIIRDSHLRLPQWAHQLMAYPVTYEADDSSRDRFCNFIYSNPRCMMRNAFFDLLNARCPVEALGHVGRNASHPSLGPRTSTNWPATKREVLRDYRFTIAFENEEGVGYTTEKIVDAWLADSVPIYWGNPAVVTDFAPGSYLSLYESGSLQRLVEDVLEAHNEPERFEQLRAANPFRTGAAQTKLAEFMAALARFSDAIIDDASGNAKRRRLSREAQLRAQARELRSRVSRSLRS